MNRFTPLSSGSLLLVEGDDCVGWQNQPQFVTRFNTRYSKPSFCYAPSISPYTDLVSGSTGTRGSGESIRATTSGIAYKATEQSYGGLRWDLPTAAITSELFTILAVGNPSASTNKRALWTAYQGSGGDYIGIVANCDRNGVAASGQWAAICYDQGNGRYGGAHSNSTSLIDGKFHTFAFTRENDRGGVKQWFDGNNIANSPLNINDTITNGLSNRCAVGNMSFSEAGGWWSDNDIALAVTWNKVLPDAELRELTANPWQLFSTDSAYPMYNTELQYIRRRGSYVFMVG